MESLAHQLASTYESSLDLPPSRCQPLRGAEPCPGRDREIALVNGGLPPSQTQAVLGRIRFGPLFTSYLGHEPTTSLHPRRRSPGRGDLPGAPQPSPVPSQSGAEPDHHRDPRPGQTPPSCPGRLLRLCLEPPPPPAGSGRRPATLALHGRLQLEAGAGGRPADRLATEDLQPALPGDRSQRRGASPDRATALRSRARREGGLGRTAPGLARGPRGPGLARRRGPGRALVRPHPGVSGSPSRGEI